MNIAQNDQAAARARQDAAALGADRSVRLAYQAPTVARLDLAKVVTGLGSAVLDDDFNSVKAG
jgi:hypothetical protein